jgi:uncharacterized protein
MAQIPVYSYICKVASRCNLDCDYCYMYKHTDQSWRVQPKSMSQQTIASLGKRINEHATAHDMPSVEVIMHGGEPLLLGVDYLKNFCELIKENTPDVKVQFAMQTNGVLFNEQVLDFCLQHEVIVGLSSDGPEKAANRHRLDFAGHSSFEATERALKLLSSEEGRRVWNGVLCVIDLANNPVEVYSYFRHFEPKNIDFLLPLGHYDLLPPQKTLGGVETPYADWLLEIFKLWYSEHPQRIMIRRFADIMSLLLGMRGASEEWGLQPVDLIVVETNGDIEGVDSLKVTYPGATKMGLNVFEHSFDQVFNVPLFIERQNKFQSLCQTCKDCKFVKVCGGGYFPHRYSKERGFDNPSIYCADLIKLIEVVRNYIVSDLRSLPKVQQTSLT